MIRAARLLAVLATCVPALAAADPMVLAAASTSRALDAALQESGIAAVTSYGASGLLARQIEQGAPADIFVSANPKWMAYLIERGLVAEADVSVLMSNRLVLIAPAGAATLVPEEIGARLAGENFVMADPETAPVGSYGKAALETLKVWDRIAPAFVPTRNTLATVAAVASGDAALGLVYASDAAGQPGVQVVWDIPEDSYPPIRYLVAPLAQGEDAEGGAALRSYLGSAEAAGVLAEHGFIALEGGT